MTPLQRHILLLSRQSLLFDYASGDSIAALGGTFSRASTATYTDANGVIQTASSGTIRDAHYINGVRTTLLEGARTNLALRSGDVGNASWSKTNLTATTTEAAPDGTSTGGLITLSAGSPQRLTQTITVTASTAYTLSFWAKRGTATEVKYALWDATAAAWITTATSYYSSINSSTWTRVSFPFTTPVGCTSVQINPIADTGVTGTVYAWGLQLEAGSFPSSYIPTTSATVTRAADSLSFPFPYPPQEMTVYARFVVLGPPNGERFVHVGNGVSGNPRLMGTVSSTAVSGQYVSAVGATSASNSAQAVADGDSIEAVITIGSVIRAVSSKAGAASVIGGQTAMVLPESWSAQQVFLGSGSSILFGGYRNLDIYKGARDMTYMRAKAR